MLQTLVIWTHISIIEQDGIVVYGLHFRGVSEFSNFPRFNAWMSREGIQPEIPRDKTYQDMDTTAS